MVNNDRIVPVQKIDYLSLIGTVMMLIDEGLSNPTILPASDTVGNFTVATSDSVYLANQPVKTLNVVSGVTSGRVLFVAGYDFVGFTYGGNTVTPTGDAIKPDGVSLYMATLGNNTVEITELTPSVPA